MSVRGCPGSTAAAAADPAPPAVAASQPRPVALLRIEDEGGRALLSFHQKLAALKGGRRQRVRISHWGASHTAADVFTGELRARLQAEFGDGGAGFVLVGKPWPTYRHEAVTSGVDRPWVSERLWARYTRGHRPPRDDLFGVAGISVHARSGRTAFLQVRKGVLASLDLYYLRQPGGGRVELLVSGSPFRSVSTAGRRVEPAFVEVAFPAGTRRVELRTRGGEVRLFGADLRSGRPGVVYDTLGLNGARAAAMLRWNQALLAAHLSRMAPDLVVVGYGGNDVDRDNLTRAEFAAEFGEMLSRLRRFAPGAACLVLGPPDRGKLRRKTGWEIPALLDLVVEEERRLARQHGCAFWDQRAAMGGSGSIVTWVRADPPLALPDRVHFTRLGYRLFAEALYHVLLRRP
jgi:lysophospholipase L1-like esterase